MKLLLLLSTINFPRNNYCITDDSCEYKIRLFTPQLKRFFKGVLKQVY